MFAPNKWNCECKNGKSVLSGQGLQLKLVPQTSTQYFVLSGTFDDVSLVVNY